MTKTLAFILSASLAACAGQADVRYSGDATTPELVAMDNDPNVMVVANADEPIFYSDSSYWLYRDNHWYRSSSHRGGWAEVNQPPDHVRRISQPYAYVHFHHNANGPRTSSNETPAQTPPPPRADAPRPRAEPAPRPDTPHAELQQRPDRALPGPAHEPNSQGPNPPYPNPLPDHQAPPAPDHPQ